MRKYSLISVVILFCMAAMPFRTAADDFLRGDVDLSGRVSIDDVTCLINYLLTQQWPEEAEPETVTYVVNGIEVKMVRVEGGTFTMGASGADLEANDNEFPAHNVTLSTYYICTTEVTQQLYRAVMGSNPSHNASPLYPVENLSWSQCQTFITKLNQMTGQTFRLPTEAEWEYAARGGNRSQGYKYAGSNTIGDVAWYYSNSSSGSGGKTHQVATKAPNELGLYDMSGNVEEWCSDWYGSYSSAAAVNPKGPSSGSYKVVRGGYYSSYAKSCRVTYRENYHSTSSAQYYIGLRLAM